MDEEIDRGINPIDEEFTRIFNRYLPEDIKRRDNVKVLSVGCGVATEASGLLRALPNAEYRGIDTDELQVNIANDSHNQLSSERFHVDVADAHQAGSLGEDNDLVLLRNPAYSVDRMTHQLQTSWSDIFTNCIDSLKVGGYIFLTATENTELDKTMMNIASDPRIDVVYSVARNTIQQGSKDMAFKDEYVALVKRAK